MKIHCPDCGYEGEPNRSILSALMTLLSRFSSQTNVACPKCGFQKAFSQDEWDRTHASPRNEFQ